MDSLRSRLTAQFELTAEPLLSRSALDRAEHLRGDAAALAAGWADALLLRVNSKGQVRMSASGLTLDAAVSYAGEPLAGAVFLGVGDGRHIWAIRDDAIEPAEGGKLRDLRVVGSRLDDASAGMMTAAVALLNWHDTARFSAVDGTLTRPAKAGWSRISEAGHEEFPRTDPAVICLIHDGADQVLLARQSTWPETLFSILAGFVEAGESLEACVAREMREEVGLEVRDVRYLGSQPWPFPRSIMLGFSAVADPSEPLVFSDGEIGEAHWFSRDEVRDALEHADWKPEPGARLLLPGSISIARGIVQAWVNA